MRGIVVSWRIMKERMVMTTNQTREQLRALLDICIDIHNQGIADLSFDYNGSSMHLLLSKDCKILYNEVSIRPAVYGQVIEWLSKVASGDLGAIPKEAEIKSFESLKEKYQS
jgi:hypothetical protein